MPLTIDPTTQVSCVVEDDCPPKFSCRPNIGRCVRDGVEDASAPALVSATIAPPIGTRSTRFTLTFDVDEPLALPPRVSFDASTTFSLVESDGNHYVYDYVADSAATPGVKSVAIALVDRLGNEGTAPGPSFELDFAPPAVGAVVWADAGGRTALNPNATLGLSTSVEGGATLVSARLLRVGSTTAAADLTSAFVLADAGNGGLTVNGTVAFSALAHGDLAVVELVFEDAAGNATPSGAVVSQPWTIDAVPPSDPDLMLLDGLITHVQATPILVRAFDAREVRLTGDVVGGGVWTSMTTAPATVTLATALPDSKSVTAVFRDGAHNESTPVTKSITLQLTNDQAPPLPLTGGATSPFSLLVVFNEPVSQASAQNLTHYSVFEMGMPSSALAIGAASLGADGQSVTLTLDDAQVGGVAYTLKVDGVADVIGNAMLVPVDFPFTGLGPVPDPTPPGILSPAPAARVFTSSVTLVWEARSTAGSYTINVSRDPTFTTGVETFNVPTPLGAEAPPTSYIVTGRSDHTWHWRVRSDITTANQYGVGSFDVVGSAIYVFCPNTVALCSTGEDTRAGNRSRPYQTISRALTEASSHGLANVIVATRLTPGAGSFTSFVEPIQLMTNVDVLGGFLAAADGAGGYDFSTRNMTLHETIIAHDGAVTVGAVGLRGNVLFEGFTVRGSMSNISFNFFVADCKTGFEVRSNQIIGGDATSVLANEAYALYVVNSGDAVGSGPLFRRNTIQGGERSATSTGGANKSYGAYLSATNAIFEANTIAAGTSDDSYAVYVTGVEAPILKSNVILSAGKTAIDLGTCHALYVKGENNVYPQVVISNNTVHARVCNDPVAATAQTSVAMTLDKTMAVITGNLFLGDGSAFAGAATSICVDVLPQTAPWMATFHSNTLAGCNADGAAAGDFAFRRYFGGSYGEATSLDQACQTTRNFFGTAGPTGANTYVATLAGMGFVNIGSGDYHLTGSSPAIVRSGSPYTLTNVCGATWSGNEALCTATTNPATNTFTCGSVTYDRDMVTRSPSYSRGAYEF